LNTHCRVTKEKGGFCQFKEIRKGGGVRHSIIITPQKEKKYGMEHRKMEKPLGSDGNSQKLLKRRLEASRKRGDPRSESFESSGETEDKKSTHRRSSAIRETSCYPWTTK